MGLERLVVRCLEANVDPYIEVLRGPDTERAVEMLDNRLVERLVTPFEPDTTRLAACWRGGGASIFPLEGGTDGPEADDTERFEYEPRFLAPRA